jgi:hypothetical protein
LAIFAHPLEKVKLANTYGCHQGYSTNAQKAGDVLSFVRFISFFCDVGEKFPSPHASNFTNLGGGFV